MLVVRKDGSEGEWGAGYTSFNRLVVVWAGVGLHVAYERKRGVGIA